MRVAALVGLIGSWFIYGLIRLFGRRYAPADIGWLVGPLGGRTIGDANYEETAAAEGLVLTRRARTGGLVPNFDVLASPPSIPRASTPRSATSTSARTPFASTHGRRPTSRRGWRCGRW